MDRREAYSRHTFGDDGVKGLRNVVSTSFAATDLRKPIDADTTHVAEDIETSGAAATEVTSGLYNPDVPRNLTVTVAADTDTDIAGGDITAEGRNVEGKHVEESFTVTDDTPETLEGDIAMKEVTKVSIPQQDGDSVTVSVGVGNKLGLNHRIAENHSTRLAVGEGDGIELENPTAQQRSGDYVELNTVTPDSALDGETALRAYTLGYNWHVNPINADPDYGTER